MGRWYKRTDTALLLCILLLLAGCSQKPHLVHIHSTPPGAMVLLNGRVVGETPFDISLSQRRNNYNIYIFKAIKEDYMPHRQAYKEQFYTDKVHDVVPKDIHFDLVRRKVYPVSLSSDPTHAIILLNGEIGCETPCSLEFKERIGNARTFHLTAVKEGYINATETITEYDAEPPVPPFAFPHHLHFTLTPKPVE